MARNRAGKDGETARCWQQQGVLQDDRRKWQDIHRLCGNIEG